MSYAMNPYRRKRGQSDDSLEFEEYEDDDVRASMDALRAYELNPYGRGPRQRDFGPGGGFYDSRDHWRAGGGRYRDPAYLPPDYPDGSYHAGGGQVSHGFHPGSGYVSNPYGGSMLDDGDYQSPYSNNPYGRGPLQHAFGPGGGFFDGRDHWRAGGGRYRDPAYLPPDYPDGTYHAGGGQVSHGFHPGSGYFSNPYGGSMLDDGDYQSPYSNNPYLRMPPQDPLRVPAYNNPPYPPAFGYGHLPYAARVAANPPRACRNCGCLN